MRASTRQGSAIRSDPGSLGPGRIVHVVTWSPVRAGMSCHAGLVLDVAQGPDRGVYDRLRVRIFEETVLTAPVGSSDREAWADWDPDGGLGFGWHWPLGADCNGIAATAMRKVMA